MEEVANAYPPEEAPIHFISIQSSPKLQPHHFLKLENNITSHRRLLVGNGPVYGGAQDSAGHNMEGMGICTLAYFISHTCHRVIVQPGRLPGRQPDIQKLPGDSSRALGGCHLLTEECRPVNFNLDCWAQSANGPHSHVFILSPFLLYSLYLFSTKVIAKIWK